MKKIDEYRKQIDAFDKELLQLFQKRMAIAEKIAEYKRENALPIEDRQREDKLVENKLNDIEDAYLSAYTEMFFRKIIELSKCNQRRFFNLYIIGMPYSGKTALAEKMREHTQRQVVDTDELIERSLCMTVPEIFEKYGEDGFRRTETAVLKEIAGQGSLIVSTGGGILTIPENVALIKNSGLCVLADRPLGRIVEAYENDPFKNRPLIKNAEDIELIYFERFKLYRECADFIINPEAEDAMDKLLGFMSDNELF